MHRSVLYIAYEYPPVGGAGVQRTTKFVKYLPQFGWQPSVLTVANPSVPLLDHSLTKDIPERTAVCRARTWEPGYALKTTLAGDNKGSPSLRGRVLGPVRRLTRRLAGAALQPDTRILWMPEAVRAGEQLLRASPHHAIVVSGPPYSSFLIGAALSRRCRLPLVLDYRDEWDISNAYWEHKRLGALSLRVQTFMQQRVVRAARALVATTRSSAQALDRVRLRAGSRARVTWIYNGFDPDDFNPSPAPPRDRSGVYRLAYVGTLWNLTSVAPLVEAVQQLCRSRPELASRLELVFVGRRMPAQQQILDRLHGLPCRLVEHPYLDHRAALELVRTADGLCVLLSDVPGAERVVPAKIFEYLATQRPILVIAPPGELWDILAGCPAARLLPPADSGAIARCLADEVQRHLAGNPLSFDAWDASPFNRRQQAGQLAALLDSLA
jgi:glycosyltransferase involved in cell wall biosynthesis